MTHANVIGRSPAKQPVSSRKPQIDRGVALPRLGKPHPKGYRAKIGGRRFGLGRDADQAQDLLDIITAEWRMLEKAIAAKREAKSVAAAAEWSDDVIKRIEQLKVQQRDGATTRTAKVLRNAARPTRSQPVTASSIVAPARPAAAAAVASQNPPNSTRVAPAAGQMRRLSAAIEDYLERRRGDMRAGQIQPSRMSLIHFSLNRLYWAVNDVPIALIGPDEVRQIVQFFLARPDSPRTGQKLAPQTVIETLYFVKKLFEDLSERGLWSTSQPLNRLFEYRRDKLYTDAEREAMSEVKVFTIAELQTLWHAAGDGSRSQLYQALALNAGFTQTEIATLRHAHLHLDGEKPYIRRFRNKTRVLGIWRLWPETVALLRKHITDPATNDLALLGPSGRPLVRISETGRADDIRHDWARVRRHVKSLADAHAAHVEQTMAVCAELGQQSPVAAATIVAVLKAPAMIVPTPFAPAHVQTLGFKFLRKTSSDLIRRIAGKDTAEVFLAHVDPTMGRHYHNPDFKRLSKALRKLRSRLWPAA